MTNPLAPAMRLALQNAIDQNPLEATRVIQEALHFSKQPGGTEKETDTSSERNNLHETRPSEIDSLSQTSAHGQTGRQSIRLRQSLGEVVARLTRTNRRIVTPDGQGSHPVQVPKGASFAARTFQSVHGDRNYKLFIPAGTPSGLVVMLHGCTQNPDDFANGTRMNVVAGHHGLMVAYPEQTRAQNAAACWNWFRPGDQQHGAGEPAMLAGLANAVVSEFNLDADSTFVAGLSAGGAMAAVLGEAYPQIFSAVGIHSGLAPGSANDVVSALSAMKAGSGISPRSLSIPAIVFHGDADKTVNHHNGRHIIPSGGTETLETISIGGRNVTRRMNIGSRASGSVPYEHWQVHGGGHAWSGGASEGSFTEKSGPDASKEMVRFFLNSKDRMRHA